MIQALPLVSQLLSHAAGKDSEATTPTTQTYLALSGAVVSLVAASLWGLAVGCTEVTLAVANLYKVPMVVGLSVLAALPPSLLSLRLSGTALSAQTFVRSAVQGMFAGTMWLGVLAPVIGLYFYTSSWAGPALALASVLAALLSGFNIFARSLVKKCESHAERRAARVSSLVFGLLQVALMWQLVAIVAPIFPDGTVFSLGIDVLRSH
jgi:hypothetical protein